MVQPKIECRELSHTHGIRVASFTYAVERGARPIEEVYAQHRIVIVHDGVFQCRSARGRATLLPGSVMLANTECSYEYTYDHEWAERCVSFAYDATVFEDILGGLGLTSTHFQTLSLAPSARFATIAQILLGGHAAVSAEEWAYAVAAEVLARQSGECATVSSPTHVERRRAIEACQLIESRAREPLSLNTLAAEFGLSPFHFLRSFKRALGFTPHQYLVQTRLRNAAALTINTSKPIVEIAFDAGFSDLANFNRSFRKALGCSPRRLRQLGGAALSKSSAARDSNFCKVSVRALP
jgi:AraC-like DNA-binding protein